MAQDPHDLNGARESANADENRIIDLNTADEPTLAGLPGVGDDRARALIKHRPFKNWIEVQQVPGFDGHIVDLLSLHGVQIGHPSED